MVDQMHVPCSGTTSLSRYPLSADVRSNAAAKAALTDTLEQQPALCQPKHQIVVHFKCLNHRFRRVESFAERDTLLRSAHVADCHSLAPICRIPMRYSSLPTTLSCRSSNSSVPRR
jgi:hypothetical protein